MILKKCIEILKVASDQFLYSNMALTELYYNMHACRDETPFSRLMISYRSESLKSDVVASVKTWEMGGALIAKWSRPQRPLPLGKYRLYQIPVGEKEENMVRMKALIAHADTSGDFKSDVLVKTIEARIVFETNFNFESYKEYLARKGDFSKDHEDILYEASNLSQDVTNTARDVSSTLR